MQIYNGFREFYLLEQVIDYPAGVVDIERWGVIDIDEAGLFLKSAAWKIGQISIGSRVRETGLYGHSEKCTLLMAIAGDIAGKRWVDFAKRAYTSAFDFLQFINRILNDIGPGTPARRRCFTIDNLVAHKHPAILYAIFTVGHRVVFRAPYYPVDGAIEYVINSIQ